MIAKQHIAFIILFLPVATKAQHTTEHTNLLWYGYYNTIQVNKKWSLVSDAQIRTRDWLEKWSQLLIRSGLNYKANKHIALTTGFAFFKNAQYIGKQLLLKNEWRPWEEFSYQISLNKISFIQRLRTEQRFLQLVINSTKSKQYEFIFRLRYRFDWQLPLQKNDLKLLLGNEVLINPGFINTSRFFDQNRTYAGIHYKLLSTTGVQWQYIKIFQWRSNTSVLEDQNVIRINIIQQVNVK